MNRSGLSIGSMVVGAVLWVGAPTASWGLTDAEAKAVYPADLGPATIDVSAYPPEQKASYGLFLRKCSICHTPARAINSPLVHYKDWEHYSALMMARHRDRFNVERWPKAELERISRFLAFDAKIRKVDRAEEFSNLQSRLRKRFKDVQEEKRKRALKLEGQPPRPYTGTP